MAPLEAWECDDCGWTVRHEQLPPGRTLDGARSTHSNNYCARPASYRRD